MRQYLDKKEIKKRKKIFQNIIVFGLFFVVTFSGFWFVFTGSLNFIAKPVWRIERSVSSFFGGINYYFESKKELSAENKRLENENLNLRLSMVDYEIVKEENINLKKILNNEPENRDFVLGNILTKPGYSPFDTIILDVGANHGLSVGSFVYSDGNIPIGRIEKIYNKTSLVSLFSSPKQKTEGFIGGLNASVELIGRGGGNFEMIVPIDLDIQKDTFVYMPGNPAVVLAMVGDVISDPQDPFKKVILTSPVNIQSLKWVLVRK